MIGLTRQLVFVACEGEPAVPTRRPDLRDVTPMKSQEVTTGPHHIRVQRRASLRLRLLCIFSVVVLMGVSSALAQYPSGPQISKDGTGLLLQDYASVPLSSLTTGAYPPPIDFTGQLSRVNFLRSEPAGAPSSPFRFFVSDSNRNLYILDRTTRSFTTYLNFEEIFPKFVNPPYSGGLITFAFGPDYATSGTFYTVHMEDPARSGSALPSNASVPGLNLSGGYSTTVAINPPVGTAVRQAILVEWIDTNINNAAFEGTAREVLRVGFNNYVHPTGDIVFNPLASTISHPDYGNAYISIGDGKTGELTDARHNIPQRLDALPGKIIRITPNTNVRPGDLLGENGRYRIPATGSDPNPFVSLSLAGVRKEIYAYGFRHPDRLSWDIFSNTLIVNDIGQDAWEEVNLATKGANYGYAEREGPEQLFIFSDGQGTTGSQTSPPTLFPNPDTLTVDGLAQPVVPAYPVVVYSHRDGDAMSSGFVYRGSLIPQLYGQYVFGDITTGRIFHSSLTEMLTATRTFPAAIHEIQVAYSSPYDTRGVINRRVYDIVADAYAHKGGDPNPSSSQGVLPGYAPVVGGGSPFQPGLLDIESVRYGGGRADTRVVEGGDGEIYILSKSDGMIRSALPLANRPPVASDQAVSTPAGTPVNIVLSANDADGDTLTYSIGTGPASGGLSGGGA
ncbi:MAG: hypothetical protein DMG16_28910, partial [Acidobacteria bacterium]